MLQASPGCPLTPYFLKITWDSPKQLLLMEIRAGLGSSRVRVWFWRLNCAHSVVKLREMSFVIELHYMPLRMSSHTLKRWAMLSWKLGQTFQNSLLEAFWRIYCKIRTAEWLWVERCSFLVVWLFLNKGVTCKVAVQRFWLLSEALLWLTAVLLSDWDSSVW